MPNKPRQTKRKGRHPSNALSAAFCRHVAEAGRYCDGNGLYLQVDPSGARRWIQKLVIRGKSRLFGLGSFTFVSLAEARDLAYTHRKTARAGGDPLAERRRARATPTFEEAADAVWKQKRGAWRNEKHARDWPTSLRMYVFPRIGDTLVSDVTSAHLLEILAPLWHAKPETGRRVRHRIGAVLKWAVAMEHRPDNPAGEALAQALGRQQTVVRHRRALPHGEVARALDTIRASEAWVATKLGFEFLVLTATRSAEVRLATWSEIDREAGVWTIPDTRMKGLREHRVPLGRRALEIVDQADALREVSGPTESAGPRLPEPTPQAAPRRDVLEARPGAEHRRRAARLPLLVPRLGRGADRPPARGHRDRPCARRRQRHRGGLRAFGPFRAATAAHAGLGRLPPPAPRAGHPDAAVSGALRSTIDTRRFDDTALAGGSRIGACRNSRSGRA